MHDGSNHWSLAVGIPSLVAQQTAVTPGQSAAGVVGLVCAAIIAVPSILKAADVLVVHAKELVVTFGRTAAGLIDRARGGARLADLEARDAIEGTGLFDAGLDGPPEKTGLPAFRPPLPPDSV